MSLGRMSDDQLSEIIEKAKKGLSLFFEAGIRKWSKYNFSVFFLHKADASRIYNRDYCELEFDDTRIIETIRL